MPQYEGRLKELGFELGSVSSGAGAFLPAKKAGRLVYISGRGPNRDGRVVHRGKVDSEKTVEEAREAAKLCVVNCLAAVKAVVGTLDNIDEIIQVHGFVNSSPDFEGQAEVMNAASELLQEVFGEKGGHVRCAIGVASLPRGYTVEVEMIVSVAQ